MRQYAGACAIVLALTACGYDARDAADGPPGSIADGPGADGAPDASTTIDSDGDGVVDASDNCPATPNLDQRDWDADLHGDACDGCPHLTSAADPDTDGDLVGDACDPRPDTPGEVRVVWLGFYDPADIAGWQPSGGPWTVSDGMLHQGAAGFSLLDSPAPYTDAYFATSLAITAPDTNEVGFCLSDVQPGIQYYCCCASNVGGVPTTRAASAWATSGGQISVPAAFDGANLAVGQHVDMTGLLSGAAFTCSITQGAITAAPATQTGDKLGTAVFYTTAPVAYRYAFVVTVP
jgi:hypothetical protein